MRVISGSLKGKPINYLKNSITRPLKDIVKEGVFNTLKHSNLINAEIKNSNILDIYAGIGSFGIECISCGAHKVTFVEKDIEAVNILNQNLNNLSILNKSKIIKSKIESFLTENINEKFNIFCKVLTENLHVFRIVLHIYNILNIIFCFIRII